MCGIAGMMTIGREGPSAELLQRLAEALGHRGPDGRGFHRSGNVGMVQTRLAIIDLQTGDQPLREPGGAALIANGEIYNYVELREQMRGVKFATQSDCEPPLLLYRRHGLDFVNHLRGMYTIALHDPDEERLVLARDPFGIKPLYYVETPQGVAFASEPGALLAAGLVARTLDPSKRTELLELQFTTRAETVFYGVRRLLPGEIIVVSDGKIIERRRRAALPPGGPESCSPEEALSRLDAVLEDSVKVHQRSDVPYGMFLSGGIDSSVVLAQMARLNPRPVMAFTAYFPDTPVADERGAAQAVAQAVRAEHIEVPITVGDFWRELPRIAAAMDDPAADYACVPTFILAAKAHEAGLKVILSGEGGDEMFGGYGRYRSALRPWWLGGRIMRRRGSFDGLSILRERATGWRDGIEAAEITERTEGRTRLQVAQAVDCADWLPNDLLTKLDRCLMAHGVEGRTPFLDPVVANFAYRLPDKFKVRGRQGKYLLRQWLGRALPAALSNAPKRGFTVPVAAWLIAEGKRLGPLVAAQPGVAEIADSAAVQKVFTSADKHGGFAAWVLLFYALWHGRHIVGQVPQGDVFDCLTTR
ncbi:MAG: asparagine synthase (glutamine-hydrolyzing) [Alphaproteobacteria bacterium]|nr:asparagine synthase (glutamine-hydrolyzing) [Alphaproteobacteria bacterium]